MWNDILERMDIGDRIKQYVNSFSGFEEVLEQGIMPDSSRYIVSPFSARNIALNVGIRNHENLESILIKNDIKYSKERKNTGNNWSIDLIKIKCDESNLSHAITSRINIRELFTLNLIVESFNYYKEKKRSMPVDDAVFHFKNEISIADDLMPSGIMSMVEGRFPEDPVETVADIQSNQLPPLFVLMKENQVGFVGFHSLLPSLYYDYSSIDHERVMNAIVCEISNAENMSFMDIFNVSRALKGIIFQLEFRKRREFPLIAEEKIRRNLEESGIINSNGRNVIIPDKVTLEEIKERKKSVDQNLHNEIQKWLDSTSKCFMEAFNQQ